jgi:regulator of replication initiation timing
MDLPGDDISRYEHGSERTPMDADNQTAALREELQVVEEELTQLRETAADLRRRIGERWHEPTDDNERAVMITTAEEQEALIEVLENRREDLLRRLGERR